MKTSSLLLLALASSVALLGQSGLASANDLIVGGELEVSADYGVNYDSHTENGTFSQVTELDFSVQGRLDFDYMASTKSGLEYGMHMELDVYQSDGVADTAPYWENILDRTFFYFDDALTGDGISFNDGYVFINSALGNIKLGDTDPAGLAKNQLNVPVLPLGALEFDDFNEFTIENRIIALPFFSERESILYSNSFAGVDVEASVDDDGYWSLGAGYSAAVGAMDVELGLTGSKINVVGFDVSRLAGSVQASVGDLTAGLSLASMDVDKIATNEYVAAGLNYQMGPLNIGAGVETQVFHVNFAPSPAGELYITNYFAGAEYELADGLLIGVGLGNLDGDNLYNGDYRPGMDNPRTYNATAKVRVEF